MHLSKTINIGGRLVSLDQPQVMGILNVTPDSFYSDSRCPDPEAIRTRVSQIRDEGATMIDIGGYSSRPGAEDVPADEEIRRLLPAIAITLEEWPDAIISIDTFRTKVAQEAIQAGAHIINDISGGEMDPDMFDTVARLHVPYILMHMQGTPRNMQDNPQYQDVMCDVFRSLGQRVEKLHEMGVADIIIDPGFGFGKTIEQNYCMLHRLQEFQILECPILVGISRKSMIYKPLGCTPQQALNGTTVLNTIALMHGAAILRVHDVKEAVETVRLCSISA
ncbi:MAG: dihydropteroate synthase [Bacteroidaceae bacterium]|nr:dihydropteroate synthase [Bacteroidaceae bacterium]